MNHAVPVRQTHVFGWLILAFGLAAVLIALNWVGYDGADDRSYALGAEAWLSHFPAVGADHWATRHTVVLPMALSLAVFGQKEFALAIPSLLYFAGFLLVNFHFARRFLGEGAAAILVMLLALTPEFLVQATYANNDIVEVFFASLSFWLFMAGSENHRPGTLLGAGVAAGLAFLTRETSAVLPVFYGVCFLFDSRPARKKYLYLTFGFIAVVGLEMLYFWWMTGDFLHRYRMDATHDTVNRAKALQHVGKGGAALDREGNLSVSVWADPLLMLFASQKFGLLFYLAVPAAVWAWRRNVLASLESQTILRAARLALLWILFISLAFKILYLVPRYYVVPAWAGVLVVACTFHHFSQTRYKRAGYVALAALLAVNALSLYVENTNPRFAERALVAWLAAHPGTSVWTDPDMARRSDLLLHFAGLDGHVISGPPQSGRLFVFSPRNQELCKSQGVCKQAIYQPAPDWTKVDQVKGRTRAIAGFLRALNLAPLVPHQILEKIESPSPGIVIYRVP